jgi:hypothetical protein
MAIAASKYRSLEQIAGQWAAQSGELLPVVLRRICDWAICGGFPEGTFVLPTGQTINLLELHRAMRVAVKVGAPINEDLAFELLRVAVVSNAGVDDYCGRIGVDPPANAGTLSSGIRRLFSKSLYSAPPDCPNSVTIVAQLEARYFAIAALNSLKRLLKEQHGHSEISISDKAHERWLTYVNIAQPSVESSGDPEIQSEFTSLQSDWDGLRATPKDAPISEKPQSDENIGPQSAANKKRGTGRPEGSGSFESDDLKLVDKMQKGIVSGEYRSIAAAAREWAPSAGGHGTLGSKEKRLSTRYAERYPG